MLVKFVMIVLGLGGLGLLSRYQPIPAHLAISVVPREICLLIVALGNIQLWIAFLGNVLLARRAVPRILSEVSMAISLAVYALFRMDALGVNLTAITISRTAVLAGHRLRRAGHAQQPPRRHLAASSTTPAGSATGSSSTV